MPTAVDTGSSSSGVGGGPSRGADRLYRVAISSDPGGPDMGRKLRNTKCLLRFPTVDARRIAVVPREY